MGLEFFSKRKKDKFFLVLDVGTEAVKALVFKRKNGRTFVLGSAVQYFEKYGVFDSKNFEAEIVKKAILKAIEQAHQSFIFSPKGGEIKVRKLNLKKVPILVSLPPNFLKGRIVERFFKREKTSRLKISRSEEKNIYQQCFKEIQEEISRQFNKEFGILPEDIKWVTFKILEMKIDGYSVSKLQGYEGKNLELKILTTFLPKYYFENIEEIFEDLKLNIFKIAHPVESLPILFGDRKGDIILLDVGGQISQIFLIRGGSLRQINEFKNGGEVFSQKLSETLGIGEESARILKERYAGGALSPESGKRIKEMFSEEKRAWYEDLSRAIKEIKLKELNSLSISLFGGGSLLPEIKEILENNKIEVKFIYPRDLKDIQDTTKSLKSPQYVSALLTSYYINTF